MLFRNLLFSLTYFRCACICARPTLREAAAFSLLVLFASDYYSFETFQLLCLRGMFHIHTLVPHCGLLLSKCVPRDQPGPGTSESLSRSL